ncbi:MAG TPA: hypothetical protein VG847_09935 [Chitinophagaceae bacterium]|nr:hypothetical protein [Chitinophagaceae bacterium]
MEDKIVHNIVHNYPDVQLSDLDTITKEAMVARLKRTELEN